MMFIPHFPIQGKQVDIPSYKSLKNYVFIEVASAGVKSQTNTNKQMGFIQKCTKCPKEYVEYETKKDNNYLCYICR